MLEDFPERLKEKGDGAKLHVVRERPKKERERRRLHFQQVIKDPFEIRKATKHRSSNTFDVPRSNQLQSRVAAKLSPQQKDLSENNGFNEFGEELRFFGYGEQKKWLPDGQCNSKSRRRTRFSIRKEPFQCFSSMFIGEVELRSRGNCNAIVPSRQAACPPEETFLAPISEKTSPVRFQKSRRRKGLADTFIDIDEEDAKSVDAISQAEGRTCGTNIYYPSRSHPEAIEICRSDLECLKPGSHLTSPVINFYIQYIQTLVSATDKVRSDYHFFNTYFYKKLEEAVSSKGKGSSYYMKFRRWWKDINLFQKPYIFLPIHACKHWSLVIICNPGKKDAVGPIILHLDSLKFHNSTKIFDNIESFLKEEWTYLIHKVEEVDIETVHRVWKTFSDKVSREIISVPLQKNGSDCGLFMLYFMERFLVEAPKIFKKKDLQMFGDKWFQPEDASGLRGRIFTLLQEQFEICRFEDQGSKSP